MKIIFSLGSNLDNKTEMLLIASKEIELALEGKAYSSRIFESPPYGPQDQPNFYNIVLELETTQEIGPEGILHIAKKIEEKLGRKHRYHWGPREIDIDIIFIDKLNYHSESLTIPHKEFRKRSFVLEPLKDLPSYNEYKSYYKIIDLEHNDATPLE
ncbi:2-amino-4-hydroxy-6-hydroxymethyldihydropteridine diphosphokinase [Bacteriovorax sp. BAL6_X]|uniref:2-amino-4-hydroxy-6- hydroxymethyldihydropteridine diphosphokinase n=1 Tax=Bacteriovorax sp. BAL6_X TaxID=1201290 RepID=UPI00038582AA|nr:2-amino-4-hydroxy-6-hydroxymethyldihydropteridine diphosphokinase [Bacteriovorax sp. BAL6_X]EPZ50455.1 2-amino-4-hydroxy-6-hydroxymethyldihydropteridine diphosphokinase [Bacteriovorax sp. BAL6_X]